MVYRLDGAGLLLVDSKVERTGERRGGMAEVGEDEEVGSAVRKLLLLSIASAGVEPSDAYRLEAKLLRVESLRATNSVDSDLAS